MFVVESYAAVRRFVFLEGRSRREAACMARSAMPGATRRIRARASSGEGAAGPRPHQPALPAPRRRQRGRARKEPKKSRVRSRVEHVMGVIKLKFGFTKVRYRGLEKNAHRLFAACGLTNLYILRQRFRAA